VDDRDGQRVGEESVHAKGAEEVPHLGGGAIDENALPVPRSGDGAADDVGGGAAFRERPATEVLGGGRDGYTL